MMSGIIRASINTAKGSLRNNNVNDYGLPDWYLEKIKEYELKYRAIRWLPLDIPKFEFANYNQFLEIWDKESIPITRINPDVAEPWSKTEHPLGVDSSWHKAIFKGLYIYSDKPESFTEESIKASTFTKKYLNHPMFESLIEHVKTHFPFYYINEMYIWESVQPILPHTDQTYFWNCPNEFRIMLHDENEVPTFYTADIDNLDVNYIDLPNDTNSFVWSNGSQVHGSDYLGKRKQLLVIHGVFSLSKYQELLDRSINKYKNSLNYTLEM
jgi:hypothetical protein